AAGSGWLGPVAGGRVPIDQAPPPQDPVPIATPSLLDRLAAGATNLTTGGNPLAGIVNAVNGLATGQRTDHAGLEAAQQHATRAALMNAGLDANRARGAALNRDSLKAPVVAHYGARRGPRQAPEPETARVADAGANPGSTADLAKPQ